MREPVVAGSFYPYDPDVLKNTMRKFLNKTKVEKRDVVGLVSPHAGYLFCGKTAAAVYKAIGNDFDTAVILGPNHGGMGDNIAASTAHWRTPLGLVEPDSEFVKELTKDPMISEDEKAHSREHSIEVQLPWLYYLFRGFKIVPISINPSFFDTETCQTIGNRIAETAKKLKRKALIVASSDFTHYGRAYGYTPFSGKGTLGKIKDLDMEIIELIEKLDAEKVIKTSYEKGLTICGYGTIASMLFAAKKMGAKKGELIDYTTSYEVSQSLDAVVSYAGIAIY